MLFLVFVGSIMEGYYVAYTSLGSKFKVYDNKLSGICHKQLLDDGVISAT